MPAKFTSIVLSVMLLFGCSTSVTYVALPYQVSDHPSESYVELSYRNIGAAPMCISPESFPNAKGEIDGGGDVLSLVVQETSYPIEYLNAGYCPKCVYFVLPGEEVTSRIPYSKFSLPAALHGAEKEVRFEPVGFRCKAPKNCIPDDKLDVGLLRGKRVIEACE